MKARVQILSACTLIFVSSCNPLGSNSTINGGDGAGAGGGLVPVFAADRERATSTNPIPITVTWGTSVSGFSLQDIDVTNGTLQGFSGSGAVYSFQVIPVAEGPLTITALENAAQDTAGNLSRETVFPINYDLTAPTVTINRAASQAENSGTLPVDFTVVFSEPIDPATFTASDITQNGTATGVTWTITDSGDQATYTLSATAISGAVGSLQPSLASTTITDFAGFPNSASTGTDTTAYYLPGYDDLEFWIKADSLSLANGANVTSIPDSSANGFTATEATNPPTFIATATNGKPALAFNGSRILKTAANSGFTGNPAFTIVMVMRINGMSAGYSAFLQIGEDETSGANAWFRLVPSTQQIFTGFYGGGSASVTNYPAGWAVYTFVRSSGGTAQSGNSLFINNAAVGVSPNLANPAVNLTNGVFRIGRSTANATVNADIAEVMVFGTALDASSRTVVETYLDSKYNLY